MRVNGGAKLLGLGASCLLALAGCTSSDPGLTADLPVDVAPAAVAPGFDVTDVITRARTSFREQDGRLVAGVDTHMVESQGDAIAVTPTHWPSAERAPIRGLDAAPSLRTSLTTSAVRAETPFVVRTASIVRGAGRLDGAEPLRTVRDGSVRIARGAIVERVQDGVAGVEQSWHFGARPAGEGDLVVRVAVESSEWTHRGTSERGEHFGDPVSGLGVSYGHGTWIDASGVRTAVPVRYDGTALVLSVPDRVLASSAYPAVLDPIIGPELTMGTPTTGPIAGDQWNPVVSSNGTHWLVIYGDQLFGDFDLYGVRVAASGVAVESAPFEISTAAGDQHLPSAAWNGTRWVVAWQDSRSATSWDVYATTIESNGTVAAGGGTAIAATSLPELRVRVASAGGVTLAAWTTELTPADTMDPLAVQATRIGVTGLPVDPAPTTITTNSRGRDPAVAGSASNFLVTWSSFAGAITADLQGVRINAAGTFLADAAPLTLTDLGLDSSIAWNGTTQWLVAFNGQTDRNVIESVLVPTTGPVTPVSTIISDATGENFDPSVAWNGASYLVSYVDADDDTFAVTSVRATLVSAANTVVGTPGVTISGTGNAFESHVAAMGTSFLIVWTEILPNGADVQGKRVSATGAVLDATARTYSVGANQQLGPVVASDGTAFLVAWTDTLNGEIDVYGVRVSAAGALVGSIAVLADAGAVSDASHFGSVYVLTFGRGSDVFAVNVTSATGVPGTPYALANDAMRIEGNASVACHASLGCLAAWEQAPMDGAEDDLYARRFDPVTGTLQPAAAVTIAPGNQFGPAVAASSTQFLIAFTDVRDAATVDVRAVRFTTSASPSIAIIGGAAEAQVGADVASDGTDFLVVWQDNRSGGATFADVYAARVAGGTGASLDGLGFAIAGNPGINEFSPAVAHDGAQYLVTWSNDEDVLGSRVTPTGTVVDAASPIAVSTAASAQGNGSIAAATGGPFLATYVTLDASGANRARARTIGRDPTGTMCTSGADCVTGNCVDGVCCGTATCGAGQVCSIAAGGTSDGTCTMLPAVDAGVDAGTDAGTTDDAGMSVDEDSGVIDEDGGVIDEDGGAIDADGGADADGGVIPEGDASVPETDGGVTPRVDSGVIIDGDGGVIAPPDDGGGCSCSVPGGDERRAPYAPLGLAGLAFAALIARRRRSF